MPVFERPEWEEPKTLVEPGAEGSGEAEEEHGSQ
jgi:hypothetical protein